MPELKRLLTGILVVITCWSGSGRAESTPVKVELTHWWKSGGEQDALNEIRKAVSKRKAIFMDTALENYDVLRGQIIERLSEGYPPAMTQWLAGVDTQELLKINAVQPLPEKWRDQRLTDILFPEVVQEVSQNNQLAGIPVGIHIQNMAFFNAAIYQQLELALPESWQAFLDQAITIRKTGYTPLAISDEPWQLRFVFNDILMEKLGLRGFQAFYDETLPIAPYEKKLAQALEIFLQLRSFVDKGHHGRLWNKTTDELIAGRAAMQVMGDFAKGEMTHAGKVAGKDFFCALAPGAQKTVVLYAIDTFAMLKVRHDYLKAGQELLFDVVLDPEVQAAFNSKKGGLPVRNDVDLSNIDSCARSQYSLWINPKNNIVRLPDTASRLRLTFVQNLLHRAWNHDESPAALAAELVSLVDNALKN